MIKNSKALMASAAAVSILLGTHNVAFAQATPAPDATKASTNERAKVTIYRDKMGVPHIQSTDEISGYFGAGYALAQDRLAETEIRTRYILGRMAEVAGPSSLESDKNMRVHLPAQAELEEQFNRLPKEYQQILQASHEGYLAYVREVKADPSKLPFELHQMGIEPTEFTLWDTLNARISSSRLYGSSGGQELVNLAFYRDLVAKFGEAKSKVIFDDVLPLQDVDAVPFIPSDQKSTVPATRSKYFEQQAALTVGELGPNAKGSPRRGASRALLIGAKKSASGNPMILQATADGPDMHLSAGELQVAGYTMGGSVVQGRTPYFAWSITTGEADMVDVFAEKLNPENPRQYFHKGAWRDIVVRPEVIHVRGGEPVTIEVESTVHGPIIQREDAQHIAYSQQNALAGYDLEAFIPTIDLARAKNLKDYKRAASQMIGSFNVNYAGNDGHIATMHAGMLPIRNAGVDPRLPTLGTGEYEWQGFHKDLSFALDPEQGYLHVWNNKPTASSTYGDTSRYGKGFRSWLGRHLVESKEKISRDDLHEIHRQIGRASGGVDLSVTNPAYFTPYLHKAAKGDAQLEALVNAMEAWNSVYDDRDQDGYYDSPGLPAYRAWVNIAQTSIIGDDIGEWWHKIDDSKYIKYRTEVLLRAISGKDAGTPMRYDWFNGKDKVAELRATLKGTLAQLTQQFGSADPSSWRQRVFYRYLDDEAAPKHPDKPARPTDYDLAPSAPNVAAKLGLQPAYVIDNGSEDWNMLVEVKAGDTDLYDATKEGGQNLFIKSDGTGNPNISDQVKLHENFEFKKVSMDWDVIKREAVSVLELSVPAFK